jgi:hypothetical protein
VRQKTLGRVIVAARENEAWEEGDEIIYIASTPAGHHAQEWAIEANKCKQVKSELPTHYQRHARLFSEKVAQCFPPSQPKNLYIWIKPGTPDTINCKIYPWWSCWVEQVGDQLLVWRRGQLCQYSDCRSPRRGNHWCGTGVRREVTVVRGQHTPVGWGTSHCRARWWRERRLGWLDSVVGHCKTCRRSEEWGMRGLQ